MLSGYLCAAWRNLLRSPGSALLGLCGMGLGLSAAVLVFLLVSSETSFDSFHGKADRIHRIVQGRDVPGKGRQYESGVLGDIGPWLTENAPGVRDSVRMSVLRASAENEATGFVGKAVVHFADPSLLSVFSFPLASGDAASALTAPGTAVLSPATARAYFGAEDPVGRTLVIRDEMTGIRQPLLVTAVFRPIPENSHLKLDLVASMSTLDGLLSASGRSAFSQTTYLELAEGARPADVERLLAATPRFLPSPAAAGGFRYELEPLRRIYLHSKAVVVAGRKSDATTLALFSILGGLILAAAGINVTNLQTARFIRRGKEIGMRKIAGATRGDIAAQFLLESVLFCAVSFVLAMALVEVLLRPLNAFTGGSLSFSSPGAGGTILFAVLSVTGVGLLSGLYPALFLSRIPPTAALSGARAGASRLLRKALVCAQIAFSLLLFLGTLSVTLDMRRIRLLPLGFDAKDVVTVGIDTPEIKERYDLLKRRLREVPGVLAVTASSFLPGLGYPAETTYAVQGSEEKRKIDVLFVDADYLDLYRIPLRRGGSLGGTAAAAVLVNEQADRLLFQGTALSRILSLQVPGNPFARAPEDKKGFLASNITVAGVTADFYKMYPAGPIQPLLLYPDVDRCMYLSIRVAPGSLQAALPALSAAWRSVLPHNAFDYRVLTSQLESSHAKNRIFDFLLLAATAMAAFLALIGFLGLVAYEIERRTKEIGIRRVMGATPARVAARLAAVFLKPVAVANPVAWAAAAACLRPLYRAIEYRFPFRLRLELFPLTILFSLVLVAVSVGLKVLRAARADPARALRYE